MMEITIVRSLNGDEIHGTDNGKKTGCGINLQKYASKYVMNGKMTDLKELTCEKCKTNLAKKIIKADKKEMARIIKEERARAKKGIEDEGIVPLGNTEAKITAAPEKNVQVEEAPAAPVQSQPASASVQSTIPGTDIAIDSGLAAFAIDVPKPENAAPEPQESPEDDFLAQFAISKPQEQEEEIQPETHSSAPTQSNMVQDDFLAQFAIPSPGVQAESIPTEKIEEQPETFEEIVESSAEPEAPSYEMGDFTAEPEKSVDNLSDNGTAEAADTADDIMSDEDLIRMFSIMSENKSDGGLEVLPQDTSEANSIYDNDENVVDIEACDVTEEAEEITADEVLDSLSEWDAVVNSLFGVEEELPVEPEPMPETEAPVEPEPMSEVKISNSTSEVAPSVQPIPTPQTTTQMPGFVPPVQPMTEQPVVVPVPQFAGYDMNGQPVYTYVQSQLVGYDPNGQPIFVPLQQPVAAAPVQTAPMTQPMAVPVQPAAVPYQQNSSGSRVNISKIADEKPKAMPKTFANAVANSRAKSKQNIFDMQGAQMPVLDSIEDILSSMGDDSIKKKKSEEKAVPVFEEYKGPSRSVSSAPKPAAPKPAEPERPLTKAELKAKKKQEKIDQKFKKDLAKRGF